MDRLVILVESYFQERDRHRYGLDILRTAGFEIEVWEVFASYRRDYAKKYAPPDPARPVGFVLRHFSRLGHAVAELERLHQTTVVLAQITHSWATRTIFRALSRHNMYFGYIQLGGISPPMQRVGRRRISVQGWRDGFYAKIPDKIKGTRAARFVLLCGGSALAPSATTSKSTDFIWTHALDYDIVLQLGRSERERRDHIVFLDEFVPFHPDYLSKGISAPNTADEYFPKLCSLFRVLEERTRLRVIVAAHPRADYHRREDYFGGRSVLQGETARLVRDSALVVTHSSVSNSFTASYRKPLLVLTSDGLSRSYYGPYIEATAKEFGAPIVNVDANLSLNLSELLRPNMDLLEKVFNRHVKRNGTPEKNTWRIASECWKKRVIV